MKQPLKEMLKKIGGLKLNEAPVRDKGIKVSNNLQQLKYNGYTRIEFNTGREPVSWGKKELEAILKLYKQYKSEIK